MNNKLYICDFDGTITREDTLDHIAMNFFPEDYMKWKNNFLEGKFNIKDWIRSFEKRFDISKLDYDKTLENIEIDKSFKKFYKDKNIIILSGGFDYNINKILKDNDINGLKVYANHLEFVSDNNIKIDMEYINKDCYNCGVCKTEILNYYKNKYDEIIYIGDGISDFCAAKYSDIVYVKAGSELEVYMEKVKKKFISFDNFEEIN